MGRLEGTGSSRGWVRRPGWVDGRRQEGEGGCREPAEQPGEEGSAGSYQPLLPCAVISSPPWAGRCSGGTGACSGCRRPNPTPAGVCILPSPEEAGRGSAWDTTGWGELWRLTASGGSVWLQTFLQSRSKRFVTWRELKLDEWCLHPAIQEWVILPAGSFCFIRAKRPHARFFKILKTSVKKGDDWKKKIYSWGKSAFSVSVSAGGEKWKALQSSRLPAHSSAWDLQKRVPPPNKLIALTWQPALKAGVAEQPQLWGTVGHWDFPAFF